MVITIFAQRLNICSQKLG